MSVIIQNSRVCGNMPDSERSAYRPNFAAAASDAFL